MQWSGLPGPRPRETRPERPKMRPDPAGLLRPRPAAFYVCDGQTGQLTYVGILHTGIGPAIVHIHVLGYYLHWNSICRNIKITVTVGLS